MTYGGVPVADSIEFEEVQALDGAWDRRIGNLRGAGLFHRAGWATIWREIYGHRGLGLIARRAGADVGALLLIRKPSFVRGRHWIAVPYFDAAGPVGDENVALPLVEHAATLARADRAKFLEVRTTTAVDWPATVDSRKAHVLLDLPESTEDLLPGLPKKVRSQVRRGLREGFELGVGGPELVPAFHAVYSERMRELGSPAHGVELFRAILREFPEDARVVTLAHGGEVASAAFLVRDGDTVCIPWASTLGKWNRLSANMVLYHACLTEAIAWRGRRFDFGRGDSGSSHMKFKLQWGGREETLCWYRFPRVETVETGDGGEGRALRAAAAIWQRLPLGVTRKLGPLLVRQFS